MKRGPKNIEDTVVIEGRFGNRPDAPEGLNEQQSEIWAATVASESPDFFNTAALRNLLIDYCRHREAAESISSIIDSFKAEWLKNSDGAKRYHLLLKMRDLETRAAASMATKLRLTNQSRYTPTAAATSARNAAKGYKPWDD